MAEKKERPQPTKAGSGTLPARSSTGLATMFDHFFRPFDELFPSLFPRTALSSLSELSKLQQPILDIQDRGDHFSVTAGLPGFTKDEVQVKVDSNGLELRADKSEKKQKEKDGSYQTSSRAYYQYLSLPGQVVADKVNMTMKNGILELKLPKRGSKLKDTTRRVDLK